VWKDFSLAVHLAEWLVVLKVASMDNLLVDCLVVRKVDLSVVLLVVVKVDMMDDDSAVLWVAQKAAKMVAWKETSLAGYSAAWWAVRWAETTVFRWAANLVVLKAGKKGNEKVESLVENWVA